MGRKLYMNLASKNLTPLKRRTISTTITMTMTSTILRLYSKVLNHSIHGLCARFFMFQFWQNFMGIVAGSSPPQAGRERTRPAVRILVCSHPPRLALWRWPGARLF